jgi:hypothetical protein
MGKVLLKKAFVVLLVLISSFLSGNGQTNLKDVTHYLFPEFMKATVLLKNGTLNNAVLNYNSLTEEMIFENRGTKLALGQLDLIDTVYIADRKFIPLGNAFVELIFKSNYSLFAAYKCKINDPGKPAGYGTTSQTSAISTYSTYFSGGRAYEMKLPEGIETQSSVEYWLEKDGKMNKFLSIRQLSKLVAEKEDLFKSYVKEHDVKYDDQASMVELLNYIQSH